MSRTGSVFIAICMVLISGSAGALVISLAGATLAQGLVAALTLLLLMVLGHYAATREADRREARRSADDVQRQLDTLSSDLTAIAHRIDRFEMLAMDKAKLATAPIAAEIDQLGGLVKQFAETLSAHESAINLTNSLMMRRDGLEAPRPEPAAPLPPRMDIPPLPAPRVAPDVEAMRSAAAAAAPERASAEDGPAQRRALIEAIGEAVEAGRMDLYLQPIVTLPQRKVRWYEALTRLRAADGTLIDQSEWRGIAEAGGHHIAIDRQAVMRAAQVVKRLVSRNRDTGIIITLSGPSLADTAFARELYAFLAEQAPLARIILLQLGLNDWHALGQSERRLMAALASLGYRFAIDEVEALDLAPQALGERGVKLVKVAAGLILAEAERPGATLHPADLAGTLQKAGIDMVAADVDEEAEVLDLIDFDLPLAQGGLFAPPRPVRSDILGDEPMPASSDQAAAAPIQPARAPVVPAGSIGAAVLGSLQDSPQRRTGMGPGLRALIRGRRG